MPSYNHAKYVLEATKSVLDQTYEHIELIVIDDGSTDDSVKLLKSINDSRISLRVQENQGAHNAINLGLSLAQGDYLCIINSDDMFALNRIERCVNFINKEEADFICTWIQVIDGNSREKGIKKGWSNMRPSWSITTGSDGFWETDNFILNLLSTNFISTTSNMFFRRSVYNEIGGMRCLRFCHDWDFALRVASKFPCFIIPEPLISYRVHDKNTISSNKQWMMFEICLVLAVNLFRFEGSALFGKNLTPLELQKMIDQVSSSIYFQGYDRMFWIMRTFIESRRKVLENNVEDELFNNSLLRECLLKLMD
ncbi:MAG: glycosyltransferase [Limnospira sp. PMC 1293.21]|nr:glycosyltransferase [Limnospira sp. PMC 1293.21]